MAAAAGVSAPLPGTPELSIILPLYREGEHVAPVLRALAGAIHVPFELLVVYDFDEDPTVPVLRSLQAEIAQLRPLRNDLGRERDEDGHRRRPRRVRARLWRTAARRHVEVCERLLG